MHFTALDSPLGRIGVFEQNGKIVRATFFFDEKGSAFAPSLLTEQAAEQLKQYFHGKRKKFDLPISFENESSFRQKVYSALLKVPYGKTATYKELAVMIGQPNAARAVGGALNKNPLLIFVPCHRVIGANANLTGFAGGVDKKRFLLELEKSNNE